MVAVFNHSSAQDLPKNILGCWKGTDRDIVIEIFQAPDSTCNGRIMKAESNQDVGKLLLQQLRYDDDKKNHSGLLVKPDNGMTIGVAVSIVNNQLKVIARILFITKTFVFTRAFE